MKKGFVAILLCMLAWPMVAFAQGREDAFVVGIGFSVPGAGVNENVDGGVNYNGGFRRYEIGAAYEKIPLGGAIHQS